VRSFFLEYHGYGKYIFTLLRLKKRERKVQTEESKKRKKGKKAKKKKIFVVNV